MVRDELSAAGLPPVPRLTAARLAVVLGLFAASRLLLLWVANAADAGFFGKGPNYYGPSTSLAEMFFKWDSHWYAAIADKGYDYQPGQLSSVAFYPLYPLLMRALAPLMPWGDVAVAGYVVSNAALALACVALWKLAALEFRSVETADRAVALLAFCPGAVWFSMIYSESVFVLTLLCCLLWGRQRRWLPAALAGFAVALSRTPGLVAGAFLALEAFGEWRERRRQAREPGGPAPMGAGALALRGLAVFSPALGLGSYMAFLQWRFGDWLAQQHTAAAAWKDTGLGAATAGVDPAFWWLVVPLTAATLLLVALLPAALPRRWSYPALSLALLGLYWLTTNPNRWPRYLSVVAPIFLSAAWLGGRSRVLDTALLAASVALAVLLTALIVSGHPIY